MSGIRDDIVVRLRYWAAQTLLMSEAADEIEWLRLVVKSYKQLETKPQKPE